MKDFEKVKGALSKMDIVFEEEGSSIVSFGCKGSNCSFRLKVGVGDFAPVSLLTLIAPHVSLVPKERSSNAFMPPAAPACR